MLAQRFPQARIEGVEIDPTAADCASSNAAASPFSERVNIHAGGFFSPVLSLDSTCKRLRPHRVQSALLPCLSPRSRPAAHRSTPRRRSHAGEVDGAGRPIPRSQWSLGTRHALRQARRFAYVCCIFPPDAHPPDGGAHPAPQTTQASFKRMAARRYCYRHAATRERYAHYPPRSRLLFIRVCPPDRRILYDFPAHPRHRIAQLFPILGHGATRQLVTFFGQSLR
ncbi:hypothetical protein [Porphyromonas loveana]|uniref:hypothetical protein n=1 Tax=Porphyromonas loveana TaxID=1884669 RepID=UPI0035A16011